MDPSIFAAAAGLGGGVGNLFSNIFNAFTSPTGFQQFDNQNMWATKNFEREDLWRQEDIRLASQWRNEDIARQEQWRYEDIERNSLQHRMGELRDANLHPALAVQGFGGGGGGMSSPAQSRQIPQTGAGGRVPRPVNSARLEQSLNAVETGRMMIEAKLAESEINLRNADARRIAAEAESIENNNSIFSERTEREIELHNKTIDEMNSRINSSEVNDKLTDKQKEKLEKEIDRMVHDNKILLKDGTIFLTGSTTVSDILGDLIRAVGSTELATRILRALGLTEGEGEFINNTTPPGQSSTDYLPNPFGYGGNSGSHTLPRWRPRN